MTPVKFDKLTTEEKIDFFVRCQDLLIRYHPDSEFLTTEDNIEDRKLFVRDYINKYKGFVYWNDNVCILFNKVKVKDPKNPIKTIKDNLYKEPNDNFNAYSIDWVVFRKLLDCLLFCKEQYEERIKYVLFVRNNEVKLHETTKLITKLDETLANPLIHLL